MEPKKGRKGLWASMAFIAVVLGGAALFDGTSIQDVTSVQEPYIRDESGVDTSVTAEQIQKAELELSEKQAASQKAEAKKAATEASQPEPAPAPEVTSPAPAHASAPASPSKEYYTNVDGNQVHVPVHADSVPANATARCRDGEYSFSQHRSGTCSGHGGVAFWF